MEHNDRIEQEFDLVRLFLELWRKKGKIILIGLVMTVLIVGYKYITADATLSQETQITYQPITDYAGTAKIFLGSETDTATAEAVRTFLTGNNVLQSVINDLDLEEDYNNLFNKISLVNSTDTIVMITVVGDDEAIVQNITNSLATIGSQKIADNFKNENVMILEPAYTVMRQYNAEVPTVVTSYIKLIKELIKYAAIGFILGAFLAASAYLFLFMMDSTIKDEKDVEGYLGVQVLAAIPVMDGTKKQVAKDNKRNRRLSQYRVK